MGSHEQEQAILNVCLGLTRDCHGTAKVSSAEEMSGDLLKNNV